MIKKIIILLTTLSFLTLLLGGCSTWSKTQKGAAIGTATGATAGAFIDHHKRARGALIGAAVGGASGAYLGKQEDRADEFRKNNEETQTALYRAEEENRRREQELQNSMSTMEQESMRREREAFASSFKQVILFNTDSSSLTQGGFADIQRTASLLSKYPDMIVHVKGFADTTGASVYNMQLSQNRAESVRNALIESGIASQRIIANGMGETEYGDSSLGLHMSRRVEITVNPN